MTGLAHIFAMSNADFFHEERCGSGLPVLAQWQCDHQHAVPIGDVGMLTIYRVGQMQFAVVHANGPFVNQQLFDILEQRAYFSPNNHIAALSNANNDIFRLHTRHWSCHHQAILRTIDFYRYMLNFLLLLHLRSLPYIIDILCGFILLTPLLSVPAVPDFRRSHLLSPESERCRREHAGAMRIRSILRSITLS